MLDPRVILGQNPRKQALKAPRYFLWAGERDHAPYHAQNCKLWQMFASKFRKRSLKDTKILVHNS